MLIEPTICEKILGIYKGSASAFSELHTISNEYHFSVSGQAGIKYSLAGNMASCLSHWTKSHDQNLSMYHYESLNASIYFHKILSSKVISSVDRGSSQPFFASGLNYPNTQHKLEQAEVLQHTLRVPDISLPVKYQRNRRKEMLELSRSTRQDIRPMML